MIRRTVLDTFVRSNGYEVVKTYGISKASEISGLSRPTIYTILREHPTAPNRIIPQYVNKWEESAGLQKFVEMYRGKIKGKSMFQFSVSFGMRCWKALNQKDPISWTREDFEKLWQFESFRDPETQSIEFNKGVIVRKWMEVSGQKALCDLEQFKPKKRPKGKKKMWFLEDDELERLIRVIDRADVLVLSRLGIESGGRVSSLRRVRPCDVNQTHKGIVMFEPKVSDYVLRYFNKCSVRFFKRYIEDYGIEANRPLCSLSGNRLYQLLEDYGKRARLSKKVTSHIFKHTFVSQAGFHGVSSEIVSEQTGTDPNTLREFYAGIKEEKVRHELLDEPMPKETFAQWVQRFDKLWVEQYERIKSVGGLAPVSQRSQGLPNQ